MPSTPYHRILIALLMMFIIHPISSTADPVIAKEYVNGRTVLPDEICKIRYRNNWTEQERWVWREICEGREADLDQRDGLQNQPNNPDSWSHSRILTPAFLESIL